MNIPPFTITNESITVIWEGKTHTVQRGAAQFTLLRRALLDEKWDEVPSHLTIPSSLEKWAQGKFTLRGEDTILYDGAELPRDITSRILKMVSEGGDPSPFFKFWERLQKNPSHRSVNQLWAFLQHEGIPLTSDGCFLAYKAVRSDYKDIHTGTCDNRPGTVLEMPRNKISDDPRTACHEGFHVGAMSYAQSFGGSSGRLVICKVDPADVVCVPYDASQQKMRVCKYVVVGNHNGARMTSTVIDPKDFVDVYAAPPEPAQGPAKTEKLGNDRGFAPAEIALLEKGLFIAAIKEHRARLGSTLVEAKTLADEWRAAHPNVHLASPLAPPPLDPPAPIKEEAPVEGHLHRDIGSSQIDAALDSLKAVGAIVEEEVKAEEPKDDEWAKFDRMNTAKLLEQSIEDLRRYAGKSSLRIVGASKIPGGKVALIGEILKARK